MKQGYRKSNPMEFSYLFLIMSFVFLLIPTAGRAGGSITIDADQLYDYAQKAFESGEFQRAIVEYQRFAAFFPQDPRVRSARFQIGTAYARTGNFNAAISAYRKAVLAKPKDPLSVKSYRAISACYLKLGQLTEAVSNLETLANETPDNDIRDDAYYRMGWILLEHLDFDRAETDFNRISALNRKGYRVDSLLADIGKTRSLVVKSPKTAGVLSILPGAGYLYLGRYQDAFFSFLVNGAMIFAAYEALDHDLYVLGGILTFVELGFYAGNIYGATTSAHKINRSQKLDFIEKLKKRAIIGIYPDSRRNGICLSFRYHF